MTKVNKIIRTFQSVVRDNVDDENQSVYIDPVNGLAYGGHRRTWGVGDLMVRYTGEIPTDGISSSAGVYNYPSETFIEGRALPGKMMSQGGRDSYYPQQCMDEFDNIYNLVNGHHQLMINPLMILDFIESQTAVSGLGERVINIEPFDVANARGHFAAKTEMYEGNIVVGFSTPSGYVPLHINSKGSLINVDQLGIGEWVVVAPVGVVEGRRFVKVIGRYEPGIKISIQHFKSGLLMPGSPRYSVIAGEDSNDIRPSETRILPFIEGQEKMNIRTAPMFSVQLDTFVRGLEAVSEYKKVQLLYKNSYTKALLIPEVADNEPAIDVAFSPLSIYKSGKVLTI